LAAIGTQNGEAAVTADTGFGELASNLVGDPLCFGIGEIAARAGKDQLLRIMAGAEIEEVGDVPGSTPIQISYLTRKNQVMLRVIICFKRPRRIGISVSVPREERIVRSGTP